jgi:hypothetical protein
MLQPEYRPRLGMSNRLKINQHPPTDVLSSLNNSDEVPSMKAAWSYPVTQDVEFVVPKFRIGVNAERMGSYDPISTYCVDRVSRPIL